MTDESAKMEAIAPGADKRTPEDIIEATKGMLAPEPNSPLARLREIREEFQADNDVELELPGYRGELLGVYKPLPWEMIRQIALRAERNRRAPDIEVTVAADGLLNACVGFVYRDQDGTKKPLTYGGQEITGYNTLLRDALTLTDKHGIKPETAREIVRAMFPDDMALVSHYGALMDWQAERDESDEERIMAAAEVDDAVHPTSA
jgi:hypothetical protein